ncbi:MAG TPA: DUF3667 domain-containing protein [Caulobacteraceae bacterium]|nr:DUF3667 domain-containing protein [Caulobacteraceae bacterium]
MVREIEAAALGGLQGVIGRREPVHALPIGAPCPNCATALKGPWCHACGQSSDDHHRSLWRLSREAVEGLFDLDGRLWRTLPDLCLRPARLTRGYLDGHRVAQVPPFRLFLVVVVLVFLVAGLESRDKSPVNLPAATMQGGDSGFKLDFGPGDRGQMGTWVTARLKAAGKNPQRFEASLSEWAQRMAILALPMSAALLGLMFFWRRGVYMYDHLIFSMHSLSFQGLLLSASMLLTQLNDAFGMLLLASPVHLFLHLKGTYRLGVFGTLWRMLGLFIGSAIGFAFAFVDLLLIGLYEIGS